MRGLSLWQPWASLIALLIKRIETRSWSTTYRGPLAIHAAKTLEGIELVDAGRMCREDDASIVAALTACGVERWADLPLGAIVATATLVDVVPIVDRSGSSDGLPDAFVTSGGGTLLLHRRSYTHNLEDQRPYGDFTPGRFAWLLEDVVKLPEPIPCRGHQGLWRPDPDLSRLIEEAAA